MIAVLTLVLVSGIEVKTDGCGSTRELREEVRARLGRDPELESGASFEVAVVAGQGRLEARLTTVAKTGTTSRVFVSSDCRELIESVALAISITLDPRLFLGGAPPEPVAPPPPAVPVALSVAPAVAAAMGLAGPVNGSFGIAVRLFRGPLWLGAEGRFDLPVTLRSGTLGVSAFAALGTLSPGWRRGGLRLSVPVSLGALLVTGSGSSPTRDSRLLVLAGVEAGYRFELSSWLGLEPYLRVQLDATRITVLSGSEVVWVTWPITLQAGLSFPLELSLAQ